ncbi:hypothetical protein [Parafrankia elaeagni]|uniref:hypothetical protein n=1 Tax=Parafrankia elaeagni TaxID=222534 RepID=UPI0003A552E2|nr:hypothetical protein [Parafrankia elaeagni]
MADLWVALDGALRRGAHADGLMGHAPEVVRLLVPAGGLAPLVRAVAAEGLLRMASERLHRPDGPAAAVLFGLTDGMRGQPLGVRRRHAARLLHRSHWALAKPPRRDALVLALADEVRHLVATANGSRPA